MKGLSGWLLRSFVGCTVAAAVAFPTRAQAYLERQLISARAAGLGDACVSVADDATSVVLNPAGLAGVKSYGASATYHKPYGLDGLDDGFLAAAWTRPQFSLGLGVYHRALLDIYSESTVTFGLARDIVRTAEDASLSVGVNLEAVRVEESARLDVSGTAFTVGVGVSLRPFATVGVGYFIRNVGAADLSLIDGSSGSLGREHSLGLSYRWDSGVLLTLARKRRLDRWEDSGGVELEMSRSLVLRAGVNRKYATGGFGVRARGVEIDVAAMSHDILGASYILSIGYSPPVKSLLPGGGQ